MDRLLGTNCFSAAVSELTSDCRRMEPEAKTRLALRLANCQLAVQGSATFPCAKRQPIRDCTEALSERAHALFVEFLTHADTCAACFWRGRGKQLGLCVADCCLPCVQLATASWRRAAGLLPPCCPPPRQASHRFAAKPPPPPSTPSLAPRRMCLHIQNQNFERYTENMLNRLAEGAGYAREQLGAVAKATGKLGADTAALALKAEAALGMLREHGELEQVRAPARLPCTCAHSTAAAIGLH